MIEVSIPASYRRCQCCGGKAFREYTFRLSNQGTQIALCHSCINILNALTNYPPLDRREDDGQ